MLTGTAAGIAIELGVDARLIRLAFVLLAVAGGWGVLFYIGFAALMWKQPHVGYVPVGKARSETHRVVAVVAVVIGVAMLCVTAPIGLPPVLVLPAALLAAGAAGSADWSLLRWRPSGTVEAATASEQSRWRLLFGLGCVLLAVVVALSLSLSLTQAISGSIVAALVLVGAAVVFAPMLRTLGNDLMAERRERIRVEERSEMAAHLHDSVLQTLTLIQKRSNDSTVTSLARRQERELRGWLFDDRAIKPNLGFRSVLEQAMAAVEETHNTPIEVVVVGDAPVTAELDALVRAATEAANNAARHSGAAQVDVFAEISDQTVEIFVRDQGCGFDPESVDPDRVGVRDSIRGRMERLKGTTSITTGPGEGTEVELVLPFVVEPEPAR